MIITALKALSFLIGVPSVLVLCLCLAAPDLADRHMLLDVSSTLTAGSLVALSILYSKEPGD